MTDSSEPNSDLFVLPQYGNSFDFTLALEHGVFTILPASLLIIIFPILLYHYARKPVIMDFGWLFFAKTTSAFCLLGVQIAILVLWAKYAYTTVLSIVASSLSCGATLCTAILLAIEHRHSIRPSSALSVYFALTVILDFSMARSCIKQGNLGLYYQGTLFAITAAIRGVLLLLQEKSKRRRLSNLNLQNSLRAEVISGFWNRPLFIWLNKILFLGFEQVLDLDDLDELGPELLTTHLNKKFSSIWAQTPKDTAHCLTKACVRSLASPAFAVIVPRLFFTAFQFSQPLLLKRVALFLAEEEHTLSPINARGLIGATVIIYFGIAVSRAVYTRWVFHLVTSARGILVSQLLMKSLTLEHSKISQNEATTLMTTDVETLTTNLPTTFEFAFCFLEIVVGTYLLHTVIKNAAFLIIIPFLVSSITGQYVGGRIGPANISWNEKIHYRISETVLLIKQITHIKILGLDSAMLNYIQNLRIMETKTSHTFRKLATLTATMANVSWAMTPVMVIAGLVFLPDSRHFSAEEAFTTLSIILVVFQPMMVVTTGYKAMRIALASVQRIQVFLLQEERKDDRTVMQDVPSPSGDLHDRTRSPAHFNYNEDLLGTNDIIVQARQLSIKDQTADRYVLREASFIIRQSTLTIVTGPVGSGKSLLLRALLGETNFEGYLGLVNTDIIAFCDQTPWIRNTSIRDNIIGDTEFYDAAWYDMVVQACSLTDDLLQLPEGDETFAGSGGVVLSGGQKQRVALARAVYSRAAILILDDPFSGLDQQTSHRIASNLLGAGGVLTQLRTTVVMVTHLAYCAEFARLMISLDGVGNLTTTHLTRGALQSQQAIAAMVDSAASSSTGAYVDDSDENDSVDEDADTFAKEEKLRLEEAQEDTLRRKGNLALCLFYVRSTKWWMVTFWFAAVFATSLSEIFCRIYIRIWLELDANNNLYFIGFAILGLLCCVFTAVLLWFHNFHIATSSSDSLHKKLLDTLMRATLSFLSETDSGVIINRFSQDVTLISKDLPRTALLFVYISLNAILCGMVALSSVRFAAAFIPLIITILYVFQHFYLRTSQEMNYLDLEAKTPLYTHLAETTAGIYHIRSYGMTAEVSYSGLELLDISQKPFYYMFSIRRWLTLGMDLTTLGIASTLVSFTVLEKSTSPAAIGLSLVSIVSLGGDMSSIIEKWRLLETGLGAISRIRSFTRETPIEQQAGEEPPQNWPNHGHIVLSSVTATYSSMDVPNEVLHNISIEIASGQKVGIIGRTGSGKSSLLLAILNFLEYSGTIYIDGRDIATVPRRTLRSQITTITQDPLELDASVRYNLLPFQLERIDEKNRSYDAEAVEVLCRVRLWNHITTHGGLDATMADVAFSSGQLQILGIARAILHNRFTKSKVVLMDEPTSNIDLDNDAHIQNILHEAFHSCTVLMVAHHHEALIYSDMILEISEGQVVRFSPPPRTTRSMSSFRDSRSMSSFRDSVSMGSFR